LDLGGVVDERVEASAGGEQAGAHEAVVGAPARDDAAAGELELRARALQLRAQALLLGLDVGELSLELRLLRGRRHARGAKLVRVGGERAEGEHGEERGQAAHAHQILTILRRLRNAVAAPSTAPSATMPKVRGQGRKLGVTPSREESSWSKRPRTMRKSTASSRMAAIAPAAPCVAPSTTNGRRTNASVAPTSLSTSTSLFRRWRSSRIVEPITLTTAQRTMAARQRLAVTPPPRREESRSVQRW